MTKLLQ